MLEERNNDEKITVKMTRYELNDYLGITDYHDKNNNNNNNLLDIVLNPENVSEPEDSELVILFFWHDHVELLARVILKDNCEKMLLNHTPLEEELTFSQIVLSYGEAKKFLKFLQYELYDVYTGEMVYTHLACGLMTIASDFRRELWTKKDDFKPFRYNDNSK